MSRFNQYTAHGWQLVALDGGQKGPKHAGWNKRENVIGGRVAPSVKAAGLCHAYSGTCAIDIDDFEQSRQWLAQRNIDLDALYNAPDAVQVRSPRNNRGKLIYALPEPLPTKKIQLNKKTILELRCGTTNGRTTQDVLPPSPYPAGGFYQWGGDWRSLPPLPDALHELWSSLITVPAADSRITDAPPLTDERKRELVAIVEEAYAGDDMHDRENWIDAGMRIHASTGGDPWGLWFWELLSRRCPEKYLDGRQTCAQQWATFKHEGTLKTLEGLRARLKPSSDEFPIVAPIRTALDIEQKPANWLWHQWLVGNSLNVVYGMPGEGKGTLAASLVATVTGARDTWPTGEAIERARDVLVIGTEDNQATFRARLEVAGCGPEHLRRVKLEVATTVDETVQKIRLHQPALCIIDPLLDIVQGKTNSMEHAAPQLQKLVDVAEETSTAILGIGHLRKAQAGAAGSSPALDAALGSRAFTSKPRMVWYLAPYATDVSASVLVRVKSNLGPTGDAVLIRKSFIEVPWYEDSVPRAEFGSIIRGRVDDFLATPAQLNRGAKQLAAETWIREELASGPTLASELKRKACDDEAIAQRTFERALRGLGVNKIGPPNQYRLYALPTEFDDLLGI